MRHTRIVQPNYAARFRCLGSACEDTCCGGWQVPIDERDYGRITSVPAETLRSLIDGAIIRDRNDTARPGTAYARIRMLPSGQCPLLSAEKLCRVQLECGESHLPRICAEYPRNSYCIDGLSESELSLSCPEAARLVLFSPSLISDKEATVYQLTWDERLELGTDLRPYFWQIREAIVSLLLNRRFPLWQRLHLVGSFCRRLEGFVEGETKRTFAALLDGFSRAIGDPTLRVSMEETPVDFGLQLEIVLSLLAERVNGAVISPTARRVLDLFAAGLGHRRGASLQTQTARYIEAHVRHFSRFFGHNPRMLENLLVNAVLRDAFPFGKALIAAGGVPEPKKAFAMLTIQFALIKGLLIGVGGARGSQFDRADVVQTVQTASRLFEHNPGFLSNAYSLLQTRGLADARGLATLLRN